MENLEDPAVTEDLPQSEQRPRLLTRDDILAQKNQLQTREVPVPEWGGTVRLRELTSSERTEIEMSLMQRQPMGKNGQMGASVNLAAYPRLRGRLLAMAIIDDQNRQLFTEADVAALAELGAGPIERLFGVASAMSGLDQRDVDSLVGESGGTPNGGSHSA